MSDKSVYKLCSPLLVGDAKVFDDAIRFCGLPIKVNPVKSVEEAGFQFGEIDVYDLENVKLSEFKKGAMSALAGDVAFNTVVKTIREACDLVKKDRILDTIELMDAACKQLNITHLKIGIAGLNPHASDGDLFRTSVDHGTAMEIAGQGIASPDAMVLAIAYAVRLVKNKIK